MIGLPILEGNESPQIVFLKICDGVAGHSAVVALLEDSSFLPRENEESSLHHFALSLHVDEQVKAIQWLEDQGVPFEIREFEWVGWRGVFLRDPEGNIVELVSKT